VARSSYCAAPDWTKTGEMAEAPGPPENLNVLLSGPSEPMKKCHNCGRSHAESAFGTHLVKGAAVPYAKCGPCREKAKKTGHPARDKLRAEKRAAKEKALEGVELCKCSRCCKNLPLSAFATKPDGSLHGKCETCRPKHKKTSNAHITPAKRKVYMTTYRSTEKGKASEKQYKQSDAGKAAHEREKKLRNARKRARYDKDPAYNLMHRIHVSISHFISGRKATAGIFDANLKISKDDMYDHLVDQLKAKGLKMEDHGVTWEIEHKIPQEMYDFNDLEDVICCWSLRNVHVMTPEENKAKGNKLHDDIVKDVPADEYPASWNGVYPATEEAKQAKYDAIKAKKAVYHPVEVYGPYLEQIEKELAEKAAKKAAAAASSFVSSDSDASEDEFGNFSDSDDEPPASSSKAAGKRKAEQPYVPPPSTSFVDSSDEE